MTLKPPTHTPPKGKPNPSGGLVVNQNLAELEQHAKSSKETKTFKVSILKQNPAAWQPELD